MSTVIIICGPTASGKTDFAHYLAKKYNGEIICADSMQLYKQIPLITASPSISLKVELPYLLYNFLDITLHHCSAAMYAEVATQEIKKVGSKNKLPIVVGGSGLYINALISGYSVIPLISDNIKLEVQELQEKLGQVKFFARLKDLDPLAASNLNELDKQRTIRAYEVFSQTKQSIVTFQGYKSIAPLDGFTIKVILLYPERNFLYSTCNERLTQMFKYGVIEEVQAIKHLIKDLRIKAVGVQEILEYLDGNTSVTEALNLAQCRTRQYAKRQITWFKHQIKNKVILEYDNIQELNKLPSRQEVIEVFS